ncbi:unnamed protein product, partial [marine sediment metagenome]
MVSRVRETDYYSPYTIRQTVQLLDYAIRSKMPDYSHAFQPLLRPLDEYAIRILDKTLRPNIPAEPSSRHDYLYPYIANLTPKQKSLLEKNQRYLEHNLVFGRSIQKLGTLLFCLQYANEGGWNIAGVWHDVVKVFSGHTMSSLYADLDKVNTFRNTRVAHVDTKLDNAEEAWEAMRIWFQCLNKMIQ